MLESGDKMTTTTSQWRSCDLCVNRNTITGQRFKLHSCNHKHSLEIPKSPSNGVPERDHKERKAITETTMITEKPKFCGTVCWSKQESPNETFTPPTPDPVVSNSSDENRTEYYPDDPEKYIKEIKLRIMLREKTIDNYVVNRC